MERFYTPEKAANLMIQLIPKTAKLDSAIDICSGSWNLLTAAKKKWPNLLFTGIDIDRKSINYKFEKSEFQRKDGREYSIKCFEKNISYSLVLANPPFGRESLKTAARFKKLLGYLEMRPLALQRIETTMILANLELLSKNGILVIVVPSTVINGDWALHLRKYIANNYYLNSIVHLPSNVFGSDISTSILVIENRKSKSRYVPIHKAEMKKNGNYKLAFVTRITQTQAKTGQWDCIKNLYNEDICFQIKRGRIGNNFLEINGLSPVIHSTDIELMINPEWKPTRYLTDIPKPTITIPYAKNGDIIIIRVGRNAGQAARLRTNKQMMISDCVYALESDDKDVLESIWRILNSSDYQEDLDSIRKGVTIKYITKESLKSYLNNRLDQKRGATVDHYQARSECAG
ncbi:MAG: N-6 DNA methylase [Bacteroidaceae bacterium]|nr:N-6 DNA methylase [Bacteroidaceae bacterium]